MGNIETHFRAVLTAALSRDLPEPSRLLDDGAAILCLLNQHQMDLLLRKQ